MAAMTVSVPIRAGIALSVLAHLGLVGAVLLLAEVRPYADVAEQRIEVDVVTADEAPPAPEQKQADPKPDEPKLNFDVTTSDSKPQQQPSEPASAQAPPPAPDKPATPAKPEATKPEAAKPEPKPQKQLPKPASQPAEAPPSPAQPQLQSALQQPEEPPPSQPVTYGAQPVPFMMPPDANLKYAVGLGLPDEGSAFDAPAETVATIDPESVIALRQRLKSCAPLPKGLSPTDNVKIVLRVSLSPTGRLRQEPVLIEASASAKGPLLMKGAIEALTSCQPYAMLPPNKYQEWKVIDLSFKPQDFRGG